MSRAVVYLRVSDPRQVDGTSLDIQERACRELCSRQGWVVEQVYREEGVSAKTADRAQLHELLGYLRQRRGHVTAVVVYDLTRWTRNSLDHHLLRHHLAGLGVQLRSVTQPLEDSPEGRLLEGMLASIAQWENEHRRRRCVGGLREGFRRGRWCTQAPVGYLNARGPHGEPTLELDPEQAPLVRLGFERLATGLANRAELWAELTKLGLKTHKGRPLSRASFYLLMSSPVHVGRLQVEVDGERIETAGNWPALVDEGTWLRAQEAIRSRGSAAPYARRRDEFPFRGFVRCNACGGSLTAGWSRGRHGGRWAYYRCHRRNCKAPVSLRAEVLEQHWTELLAGLRLAAGYLELMREELLDYNAGALQQAAQELRSREQRIAQLAKRKERLVEAYVYERAVDQETYRRHLDQLEQQLLEARMDSESARADQLDAEATIRFVEALLTSAAALWQHSGLDQRQQLQRLLFPDGARSDGRSLIATPAAAWNFSALRSDREEGSGMVERNAAISNPAELFAAWQAAIRLAQHGGWFESVHA